jgi:hypothetical protein
VPVDARGLFTAPVANLQSSDIMTSFFSMLVSPFSLFSLWAKGRPSAAYWFPWITPQI